MPALSEAVAIGNRTKIEDAALRCFLKNGFHGVSMREIAKTAGVALGGIYNYFPDKVSLFQGVLDRHEREFLGPGNPVIQYFQDEDFPNDLEKLAAVIRDNVERFSNYFKLIYIDVIEFDGVHIRELFSDMEEKFGKLLGVKGLKRGRRPAFALTTIYLSFYQYFTLTKVFGARNIYADGSENEVIRNLIRFFEARGASRA